MILHRRIRRRALWLWIGGIVLVAAASAYAVQQSVAIHVRWKVLPYQTLRLVDGAGNDTSAGYAIPEPSALDRSRGYIEDENAVRLHVVSNTDWKIQVWIESGDASRDDVLVRRHGETYALITKSPMVLASGAHGTYDIGVDYRVPVGDEAGRSLREALDIVYTIMSD